LGVLTALVIADVTNETGRFNLAQGFVGMLSSIDALLSTTSFAFIVGNFGSAIGFRGIAAVALGAALLAWFLMPETKSSNEKSRSRGSA
jgi:hypothetical protein